jgi:hypothetical protein
MDRVHGSWTAAALVHGGPGTEATVAAHRSSCSRLVWVTVACHEVGKMKKSSSGFGSDPHRCLYNGMEVA